MEGSKYDKGSEFRTVAWDSGDTRYVFTVGQRVKINTKESRPIMAHVYSISDTSFTVHNTGHFRDSVTIMVINSKGEVFKWWEIRNGKNVSLMHNNEQYLEI